MLPLTAARYPLQKSTTLTCSRRRFPSARLCVRCAKCDGRPDCICGTFLFLFFSLSLSCKLTSSVPTCDFPRFFFNFVQFSSHCLASLLSSLLLIAPFLVLPFYLSLLSQEPRAMRPTRAPHTIKRLARARYTHGWPLLLGVCGPTSCRGPCHVAPRPQQHAARTGCALS